MNSFETNEMVVNLELFKALRIFHLFNPKAGPKIFNFNVYRLATILVTATVLCIVVYGSSGLIVGTELKNNMDSLTKVQFVGTYVIVIQAVLKAAIITYNADKFWELLHLGRINFLSEKCSKYIGIFYKYRKISMISTKCITILGVVIIFMWTLFPLVINVYNMNKSDTLILRYENILNLFYPVTLSVYNQYYFVFYFMENIVNLFYSYVIIVTNIILISFFLVLISQYETIFMAFENVGYKYEFQNGK